jgi:hypothetical protein
MTQLYVESLLERNIDGASVATTKCISNLKEEEKFKENLEIIITVNYISK